ncbi:FecR domain-containing protein [Larkinella bovis]|uniref:FecR domain-containing protein n=1 Tax=Larkinella bovis TaxID=683041 RepID=A0ABW0I5G5_9BACT
MPDQPENRIDDDLLGKYLAGETDATESERVRRWLGQDHSERQEFDRFEKIWNTAGSLGQKPNARIPVDTDRAWQQMRGKMRAQPAKEPEPVRPAPEPLIKPLPIDPSPTVRKMNWWQSPVWAVAAMAVLLSGLLWFFLREPTEAPAAQLMAVTTDQKVEKILPDGSKVLLNQNSKLSYPEKFASDSREVQLDGEAFFEVKPDPTKPFRIHVRQTTVQVLGTSFSIRAYTNDVRVAVRTGKVKFSAPHQAVTLVKNEQATFNAVKDTLIRAPKFDANAMSFQTGRLVFEREPLSKVVETLNEVYHADIHLAHAELGGRQFNGNFNDEKLDFILMTTADAMHLNICRDGKRITLDDQPCK